VTAAANGGLILLGAFNLFAVAADLASDPSSGLPGNHAGTFSGWPSQAWPRSAPPRPVRYVTLVERGYSLRKLVFTLLFLVIVAIPLQARQ
jgi:hypothetical protein